MPHIEAWTYNADIHCVGCAEDRYGSAGLDNETARDADGNPPHPVFDTDESEPAGVYCGTCHECITEPTDTTSIEIVLREWSLESGEDESCGDASEGLGHASLFVNVSAQELRDAGLYATARNAPQSFILYLDTAGFRDVDSFDSEQEALAHWAKVVSELEPDDDEPEARDTETLDLFAPIVRPLGVPTLTDPRD